MRRAILQAAALSAIAVFTAFTFNAFSDNGIDPFREISDSSVIGAGADSAGASGIRVVDLDEFEKMLKDGATVFDARTENDYVEGHVPGAILFDYYQFGQYLEKVQPYLLEDGDIVIYCSSITCDDSELLARELYSLGFTKLSIYKGGMSEWVEEGRPVEEGY